MADLRGNCLCGAIAFEYTGPIHRLQACHCLRCRNFYGSGFGPIAIINREGLASCPSNKPVNRYSCRTCGSPLPMEDEWDPLVGVPLSLVEEDRGQVTSHIFVGSKAPWHVLAGDGAQHEVWSPNKDVDERFRDLTE